MAIKIPSGLNITVKEPVDSRLVLTKAQMRDMVAAKMPDNYICICSDDSKLYIYNSKNTPSASTGLFVEYEEIIDIPAAIRASMDSTAGKVAMAEAIGNTLPDAMAKVLADDEKGQELVENMFDNSQFALNMNDKIEFKVNEAISLIEAIDGMA